jgi:N-acetylmuramoyl-L-alanine amidase
MTSFSAETAKPKDGEGVYRFLLNNGRNMNDHYDVFVALNKGKLGRNNTLLSGVSYVLPPLTVSATPQQQSANTSSSQANTGSTRRREPLFGSKYADYTINSNRLKGATFYLVSGHGGPDSGAVGKVDGVTIHEDEYAYDIMLRLARNLLMEGATVHVIIQDKNDGIRNDRFLKGNKSETCRGKPIPLNQVKRLQQRCDEINALSRQSNSTYQRAVFIHLDSRSTSQQVDVFFYYKKACSAGRNLASTMRNTFRSQYQRHQPNRGFNGTISTRELFVLNNTNPISLFAELGNIQNSFDQRRFLVSDNRQALANWMCRGFIADFENSKK